MRVNSVQACKTVKLDKCARSRTARVEAGGGACFGLPEQHEGLFWCAETTLTSRLGTGSAGFGAANNAVLLIPGGFQTIGTGAKAS
jgi:hypothetical protein